MEILEIIPLQAEHQQQIRLYERAFPRVARFVSKMNGTLEDAKDIFQDALVIFYEKQANENFNLTASGEAYILGIAKHLWIRKFKRDHHLVSLDDIEWAMSLPEESNEQPNENKLLKFLENTGKKCLDVLRGFYYEKLPTREITEALGYRNDHTTAVQKFKCLEKLRNTIKEKALDYEDFLE
ncbi:MAG TPA: sigma-70 family RNA polymerase sigma factor [Cyclobacteriaceae bacterium]|nr:sigma-70 family RNA polymerase sigma factor [Cyclobacteriaceae bacterium]